VSALAGEGLDDLGEAIERAFRETLRSVDLLLPFAEGGGSPSCTTSPATRSTAPTPPKASRPRPRPRHRGRALRALRRDAQRRAASDGA
jgi:hypothetical protein